MRPFTVAVPVIAALLAACDTTTTRPVTSTKTPTIVKAEHIVLYGSGWTLIQLPFLPMAINDAGVVVGSKNGEAVRWENGTLTTLPHRADVAGPYSAIEITKGGLILGQASGHALVWIVPSGPPIDISEDGFRGFIPLYSGGLNDSYTVVGTTIYRYVAGRAYPEHVFRWTPTTGVIDMSHPDEYEPIIWRLNNSGYSAGYYRTDYHPSGSPRPARWDANGNRTILQFSDSGKAFDINGRGDVIGVSGGSVAIWSLNGAMSLVDVPFPLNARLKLSDAGRIVGNEGDQPWRPWTFYRGTLTWLSPAYAFVSGVNSCGSIIGYSNPSAGHEVGDLWIRGAITAQCDTPPVVNGGGVPATLAP